MRGLHLGNERPVEIGARQIGLLWVKHLQEEQKLQDLQLEVRIPHMLRNGVEFREDVVHVCLPVDDEGTSRPAEPFPQLAEIDGKAAKLALDGSLGLHYGERDRDSLVLGQRQDELARVVAAVIDLKVAGSYVGERTASHLLLHSAALAVVHAEHVVIGDNEVRDARLH